MPSIVFIRRCEHCRRSFKARQGNARVCKREECRRKDVKQDSRKKGFGGRVCKSKSSVKNVVARCARINDTVGARNAHDRNAVRTKQPIDTPTSTYDKSSFIFNR